MSKRYTFTKACYFESKPDVSLSEELKNKIATQFDSFNSEYDKLAKSYNLKNCIDFKYVRNRLVELNNSNLEFTKTPIQIKTDPIQDAIIDQAFLDKSYFMLGLTKNDLETYLFNKICVNLGWFVVF